MTTRARSDERRVATCPRPKPEEGSDTSPAREGATESGGKGFALDNWSNYKTFRLLDDPEDLSLVTSPKFGPIILSRILSPSLDIIPDYEPNNISSPSEEESDRSVEDRASVPSTVQIGTLEKEDPDPRELEWRSSAFDPSGSA